MSDKHAFRVAKLLKDIPLKTRGRIEFAATHNTGEGSRYFFKCCLEKEISLGSVLKVMDGLMGFSEVSENLNKVYKKHVNASD